MNRDEKVVFDYLKCCYGENVVFEPAPNSTPDFAVNSVLAVEVRRLNQHFFDNERTEGLENLSLPIFGAFIDILKSFDSSYKGKSYWVFIDYNRPLQTSFRQIRKGMKLALLEFLALQEPGLPYEQLVNENIYFTIYPSNSVKSRLFRAGGSEDSDAGGWLIPVYVENIRKCVIEKSLKIRDHLREYNQWWLYLVDHIGWGLSEDETKEVCSLLCDIGNFNSVFILNSTGERLLATISKQPSM